jgi:prepilin-type N-terminal cleavage/methylation domain-containing protein
MRRPLHHSARGFTIVELMVSITITSVVVAALYSVSRSTTETFNQQQRAAEMQLRLRLAMERLRADVARAGYMATPNSDADPRVCPKPTPLLGAISLTPTLPAATPIPNASDNLFLRPMTMRLVGNFTTADEYLVESISGNRIRLQHRTPQWASRVTTAAEFNRIFVPGGGRTRMIRIMSPSGFMQFVRVVSGTWQRFDAAVNPELIVSPPPTVIGEGAMMGTMMGCGISGLGTGSTIAPVDLVEYGIRNGTTMRAVLPELYPTDATEAALKSDLVRSEWTLDTTPTEILGTAQLVGEYAVDFDATLTVDDATGIGPVVTRSLPFGDYVNIARYAEDLIAAGTGVGRMPQRIRSVVLRLSIRDRTADPSFGWVPRAAATDPLTRFRVYTDRPGAARVRTLTSEVVLRNIAARVLR